MNTRNILYVLAGIVLVVSLLFATVMAFRGQKAPTLSPVAFISPAPTLNPARTAADLTPTILTIDTPKPNQKVNGQLVIKGKASGAWFSEGVFPVKLLNERGDIIATGQAKAQGEWMTTAVVPFEATLNIPATVKGQGSLVFEKDNSSGEEKKFTETRIIAVSF